MQRLKQHFQSGWFRNGPQLGFSKVSKGADSKSILHSLPSGFDSHLCPYTVRVRDTVQ